MKARLGILSRDTEAADGVTLELERSKRRAHAEVYYHVHLAADCAIADRGTPTYPLNGDSVVIRLPAVGAGSTTMVQRQVPTRQLWINTRPRLNIWYTSPVGSTNTFTVRFVIRSFGVTGSMSNTLFAVDFNPPGPAVANTPLFATVVGSARIPPSPFGVTQVRVGRLGADANANDLDIILADCVFEEVA